MTVKKEEADYRQLDAWAKDSVQQVLKVSPTARVLILIENPDCSIIATSPSMIMADTLGILRVCAVRCEAIEATSFRDRMTLARKLDAQAAEGKFN